MNIKEAIQKRILDLKCKPLSVETKTEIQKLQQMIDSADTYKNNSAKNNKEEYKDIEEFLYNRYNR